MISFPVPSVDNSYSQSRGRRCGTPRMSTMENVLDHPQGNPNKSCVRELAHDASNDAFSVAKKQPERAGYFCSVFLGPLNIRKHEAAYVSVLVMLANQVSPSPSKRL